MRITVLGKPKPAGSKKAFQNRHTGRVHVVDANKDSMSWKQDVAQAASKAAQEQGWTVEDAHAPLALEINFYLARPRTHFGSGRNSERVKDSAPSHPITRPDVDKLSRAVMDGLTGVVYRDDSQVVWKKVSKRYGEPERAEIFVAKSIDRAEKVGSLRV